MPALVGCSVEAEGLLAVRSVRHDGRGAAILQPLAQLCTVVGGVANQLGGGLGAPDKALGGRAIVRLATAQEEGKKTALSICQCVDLRIAPAS